MSNMKHTNKKIVILSVLVSCLAFGVSSNYAIADVEQPTIAEMWETIKKQQQEIDLLRGIQKKNHIKVDSLKAQQGENQIALENTSQELVKAKKDIAKATQDIDAVSLKFDNGKRFLPEGVTIGGAVEIEASHGKEYDGTEANDLTLATVELSFEAQLNDWMSTNFALLYEDPDPINVDTATVTIGNSEKSPFYVTTGLMAAPFGSYETQLLSDPLTLAMGESGGEVLVLVGAENLGFAASVYAFNGDTSEAGQNNTIDHGGVSVSYNVEKDGVNFSLGAGYINSIADSDGITDALAAPDSLIDTIGGYTLNTMLEMNGFTFIGEYVSATGAFRNSELTFNGKGAKPSAWLLEVGYTFEVAEREATIAANVQGTSQALALGLPKTRIAVGGTLAMFENASLGLEWAHNQDYSTVETGADNSAGSAATDKSSDSATMKLAVEF
ncbi:MAG: LbtU family siderophore porin [Magnetococcales bacterium]|nr:LbtU family siderophore porin [Magnetococcales bacterium]